MTPHSSCRVETLLDARRPVRKLPGVDMSVDAARKSARATRTGSHKFHDLRSSETLLDAGDLYKFPSVAKSG